MSWQTKNKMADLRNHLFETIERLTDEEKPMEIERAKAVADVAQTIINSAKVELQFLDLMAKEGDVSGLFREADQENNPKLPPANGAKHK